MKLSTLHSLSRRLDASLHEFALTADANGDYPWQPGQRRHQRQRTAAGVAGSLALGGGLAYGANRAGRALKERYGVKSVKDGAIMGAAEGVQKLKGAAMQGVDKLKTAAAPMMAKAKTAAAPVLDPLKRKLVAGKLSYSRGIAQKQGAGKLIARVGRALIHASRADVLVELEAKLDGALQEFTGDFIVREGKPGDWAHGRNIGTGQRSTVSMSPLDKERMKRPVVKLPNLAQRVRMKQKKIPGQRVLRKLVSPAMARFEAA